MATITRGIKHLEELGYIFVEFVNGNNAARRIYVVFDNPKKLKFLLSKGYLMDEFSTSFPHSNQNEERVNQNEEKSNHFEESQNRGESNHFEEHRIIKDNKNIEATDLATEKSSRTSTNNKFLGRDQILAAEYNA